MGTRIYYIRADLDDPNLYHVFERFRTNVFGEPYCVESFLSYEEAIALTDLLSAQDETHLESRNRNAQDTV